MIKNGLGAARMRELKYGFVSRNATPTGPDPRRRSEFGDSAKPQTPKQPGDRTAKLRLLIECEIIPRLMMAHAQDRQNESELAASTNRRNVSAIDRYTSSPSGEEFTRRLTRESSDNLASRDGEHSEFTDLGEDGSNVDNGLPPADETIVWRRIN
jgi:hypothetical protein